MARYTYIPNRVIDSDGISDGASIYFYQSGTTTPVTIYSDIGLTTPIANPVVVAAGAAVPTVYFSQSSVRVRVEDSAGSVVSDDDPYGRPLDTTETFPGTSNTFLGQSAGNLTLSGTSNTGVGKSALIDVTSGVNLTAVGAAAMQNMTVAEDSVAVGTVAMSVGTDVSWGVAVGHSALLNVDGATYPTALGYQAAQALTSADRCTAVGAKALLFTTTGNENVGVGWEAGRENTTGVGNTAIGSYAGKSGVSANFNVSVGYQAGEDATGSSNTFIGPLAGLDYTSGSENVFVGRDAGNPTISGNPARTGSNNVAVGEDSGPTSAAANFTTCLGANATVGGSRNIAIGADAVNNVTAGNTAKFGNALTDTNVSGRLQFSQQVVSKDSATAPSNTDFLGGLYIITGSPGAPFNITSPAAANLIALIPGCEVGTGCDLYIQNTTGQTATLVAGSGITLSGTTTITAGNTRLYKLRATNVGAGTQALTIYGVFEAGN